MSWLWLLPLLLLPLPLLLVDITALWADWRAQHAVRRLTVFLQLGEFVDVQGGKKRVDAPRNTMPGYDGLLRNFRCA